MLRAFALATLLLLALLWATVPFVTIGNVPTPTQAADLPNAQTNSESLVAASAVITVTTTTGGYNADGKCSLREAIQAANLDVMVDQCPAGSGGDTIVLPAGHYLLTSGQLALTGVITLQGSITGTTILDGQERNRVLHILADATVALYHVEIRNGKALDCFYSDPGDCILGRASTGGGVLNNGSTLIAYSTIHNNQTGYYISDPYSGGLAPGGGIYNDGSLTVVTSTISNNAARGGGGIYNQGSVTITNSTIRDHTEASGIYNIGNLVISNSTIRNNTASEGTCDTRINECSPGERGGGIYNTNRLLVTSSTISGNTAGNGGCYLATDPDPLYQNKSCGPGGDGGGIHNEGILTIANSTFSDNAPGMGACSQRLGCSRNGGGGAIFNLGTLTLDNSTITENRIVTSYRPQGLSAEELFIGTVGGLYSRDFDPIATGKNNVIAGNEGSDCGGSFSSAGYNLIQNVMGCKVSGSYTAWGAHLGPLQDNGGPTLTHALNPKSPAIDAGDCTTSTGVSVTDDQRGEPRPQAAGCDIGAFESPYTSTFEIQELDLPLIGR